MCAYDYLCLKECHCLQLQCIILLDHLALIDPSINRVPGGHCIKFQDRSCIPDQVSLTEEEFTDGNGEVQSLGIIGECRCQS